MIKDLKVNFKIKHSLIVQDDYDVVLNLVAFNKRNGINVHQCKIEPRKYALFIVPGSFSKCLKLKQALQLSKS